LPHPQTENFWTMPLAELADWCGMHAQPGSPVADVAKVILEARVAREGTTELVKVTWRLAVATWVLVIATLVVAIVTVMAR
jgi:hypothetical protein